jgi:two-component system, response regulator PdtaR
VDPMSRGVPHSILVVEDEVLIRIMIADDLTAAGFNVIQAVTADEALKILYTSVEIDMVLTDVRMPGRLNGLDLARLVRMNWPNMKVIIVSADYHGAIADMPADAFFSKPYLTPDLIASINQLLAKTNDLP